MSSTMIKKMINVIQVLGISFVRCYLANGGIPHHKVFYLYLRPKYLSNIINTTITKTNVIIVFKFKSVLCWFLFNS